MPLRNVRGGATSQCEGRGCFDFEDHYNVFYSKKENSFHGV